MLTLEDMCRIARETILTWQTNPDPGPAAMWKLTGNGTEIQFFWNHLPKSADGKALWWALNNWY